MQSEMDEKYMVWWEERAAEVQQTTDAHNSKKFYDELKGISGPWFHGTAPLCSLDHSTLITHPEDLLKCLTDHFDSVLNHPLTTADQVIDASPQCHTS